ncbi:MAG: hypothetical protein D0433_04215 [Candidatus Thermochlorobacter aerophilum]|uniref:Uncharacterized protein n=1 Tax=Candidatus Thermochlorobacter aerophilus TaxID=1868324 RepID=A0A395M244_9BACT|nr:MAG: hypothetical protein D0433_04215 [Candidatus Thermochlorobacter aerophilum]
MKTLSKTGGFIGKHLHAPAQPSVTRVQGVGNSPCQNAAFFSFRKVRDVLAKSKQGEVVGKAFAVKVANIKPIMM